MIMPRNAKDSDDEMEAKSGRRTRAALNPSVLDSPLRRSSRIKQPAQQEGSSPESVSDVSSTGTTRSTKRRTATGDAAVTEATRSLRTRRNSVASDISELTETESLPDGPAKRVTRRSAASVAAVDTPPNLNGRTRRATRAGSESKSTPPVGRTTRRNRASSLEPEAIEEQTVREVGTPVKSRRRASALPSEPAVAEESEESGRGERRSATKTVYEIDEEEPDSPTLDTSMSWRRKSKNANKSAEKVDESPVRKTEDNTMERTTRENTEAGADDSHVPQKHEVSMKGADSSETKQADDGCSPEIVSPSRSSSYTIESLLSPTTEKQEKSPGNKENEILNDSAVLLEKSVKLSNRSDARLSSRNSLGSSYVKPQEKRLNISVDDNLLSNDFETSTKSQQDDNTELAKKSTPKSSRKERYSVDECVVIIEPMEINRIDKIVVNTKEVDTPESPKIPTTYEVVELTSEAPEDKEIECKLPEKEVENTENFGGETNLEISNVMSIAMTEKFDEPEPMEVDESPELLYLETNDTSDVNEEETPNESVDQQQVSVESSNTKAKSPTLISENKEANDDVVNDDVVKDDVVNDEETSTEISISDPEPRVLNTEEKTSTEPSVSKDELSILNPEDKALSDGVNDEKVSSEAASISNDDLRRSLNPEEKAPSESVNNEKTSLEASVSNDESRGLNSEEQTPSDVVNVEKAEPATAAAAAKEASNPNIELTASYSSINNEKPINSQQDEVNLLNAKDRKRSIVTETPTNRRANGEGAKNVGEEEKRRKSASNRRASNVSKEEEEEEEEEKKNGDTEEKLSEKQAEAERKAQQSDEESEYDGYPAFKDIPADEWTETSGADIENTKKNTDIERNSVHSVSTEHNDSECDFQLIDKEYSQGSEKEEQVKSDYDSDDTVKIAVAHENSIEPEDDKEQVNASVASAETPMELSSDEEEIFTTKASNYVSNLNSSLDTCRKINEPKTPTNKNISLIDDTTAKTSSAGLNSSRRKSLLCVDDRSTENSNSPLIKLNSSVKRYSLNASAPSKEDEESDNDGEADVTEHRTPKMFNRKSLEGSAKKIKSPLDSSRTTVSSKNTPSNTAVENRASETSAKRNRSLSKSAATSSQSDGADDSFDNNTRSETTMEDNKSVNMSKHALQIALKNQLKAISPACNLSEVFSNANNSLASPILDKKRFSLNKSEKIGSAEKSSKDKNSKSKYEVSSSDSDDGEEESQQEPSSPKIQLNESRKSTSAKKLKINKNKSIIAPSTESPISPELEEQGNQIKSAKFRGAKKISLSSEMDNNEASQDSSISSEAEEKILEKSVKSGSAKKSAKKNTWKLGSIDFDDNKIDYDDLQEELDKSAVNKSKIGSAKKSANHSRTSRISSDSVADDEDSRENSNESSKSASVKKSVIDKNYSTIAQVNSDSDVDVEVESDTTDDDADISRKIPRYLFNYSSESDSHLSPKSIDSDIERDMNLHGKSRLEYSDDDVPGDDCMATESESSDDDDDGVDLIDFLVEDDEDDEEFSDVEQDLGLHDNETNESFSSEEKKPRRRIIPRPAGYSDSDESPEEKPMNISSTLDKSKTPKSTIEAEKLNKTQEILETEVKAVDLNVSAKNIAVKNKNLLIQSSTPKTLARQSLLSDKSNSKEATTPLNKSAKSADSLVNLDVSSSNKLSKSVCETIQPSANLGSSFKLTKTPKTSLSVQEQLQTSLPADLNNTPGKTNLSKVKSIKLSTLNQTVIPPGSESPETRFLMKEKLNDSMPALKLQQRAKALRRSALENLDEEIQTTNQLTEEMDEIAAEKRISLTKEEDASEPKVSSEKKKKKKKKQQQKDASENSEEIATSLTESVTEVNQDSSTSSKKSKKPNKKKKAAVETPEQEETKHEEIPKKKKKKKQQLEEIIENIVLDDEVDKKERKKKKRVKEIVEHVESNEAEKEKEKKTKKRKERKLIEATEPEVPALRQKSRRIAARNDQDSGSVDDEPETMDFNVARDAALKDLRKVTESIKAAQEAKKKKYQENLYSKQERKDKTRPEVAENFEKFKTSVKRLPDDVLGNLSDVAERPRKKRKVNKEETAAASSKTTFSPFQAKSGNFQVNDGYIPLSSAGGTTQFAVVNLKKAVKHHSKKAVAASTFRERMLARNPRLPVSAYLMYQQKQKLLGKDKPY